MTQAASDQGQFESSLDGGEVRWSRPVALRWLTLALFATGPGGCVATFANTPWAFSPDGLISLVMGLGFLVIGPFLGLLALPVRRTADASLSIEHGRLRFHWLLPRSPVRLSDVRYFHVVDGQLWLRVRRRWRRLPLPPGWGARTRFMKLLHHQHRTALDAARHAEAGRASLDALRSAGRP